MPESYEWLQRRHFELLEREQRDQQRSDFQLDNDVGDFIQKLADAGADIRDVERRTQLQDWLTHWKQFVFKRTSRVPARELDPIPFNWWPIVFGAFLVLLLAGLAGILRYFVFTPTGPKVEILALGGGAVVPGDTIAIQSAARTRDITLDSDLGVSPPVDSQTFVLDDFTVLRAEAEDRTILLDEISELTKAETTDTVALAIRAVAEDMEGIDSLQVQINGQLITAGELGGTIPPRAPVTHYNQDVCLIINPIGSSDFNSQDPYPLISGTHVIKIIAWNRNKIKGESEEISLEAAYTSDDYPLWKAVTSVEPCEAGLFSLVAALPSATLTPPRPFTPTPTPTRTPVTVTPTSGPCTDNAAFVADVTVPDGTPFDPGAAFNKTWRLRNTGTCTWHTGYQLVHVGGARLGTTNAVNVPHDVPPGGEVDITVPMVAPSAPGNYRSYWRMRNPSCGNLFGVTVHAHIVVRRGAGDLPVITRFEVAPNTIRAGQQATLHWAYTNGTSARLDPGNQAVGPSGSQVVAPNATTSYRLVVSNASGSVERTTTLIVQAEPVPQPPPASPADLAITAVHGDGFDITWTDTSSDEQGFRLYNADTQQVVATFSANVTGGRIVGLACGTPYGFYLVSYNERGESWPSNTERASTSPCGG